jgi:hypothetical protein
MSTSRRTFLSTAAVAVASASLAADARAQAPRPARVASVSAMTLVPDGKLVVADWRMGAMHALALPALPEAREASFNVLDLTRRLATAYGTEEAAIRVTATVIHGRSQTAILALALGRTADAPVAIALVGADGAITRVDVDAAVTASLRLTDAPADAAIWNSQPARGLMVTDIKAHGGELIVAGLTGSTFSSTLRRVAYPFTGAVASARIEMYHAVHNQIETRAPVRAFAVIDVESEPTLLAAYTCTPLVTVPMKELKDGAMVRGKTIAELGFGNTPLDVVPFTITHQGQTTNWVMVANSAKAADLIRLDDVIAAAKAEGLSQPVKAPFQQHAGVKSLPMPITNVQRLLDQGPQFLLALRRDPATGQLQLVSLRKGAFFRLSDFINEYDLPSYAYPEGDRFQQDYIRPFHRMMKTDEGHAALVK